jgi:hypothetical protein
MKYFAYGSILDPERMRESRITFSKRKRAILKDYRLELNKMGSDNLKEGYANVMQFENGIVEGVLYDIGDRDLSKLVRYEGYPDHYGRSKTSRPRGPGFASTPWKGLQTPLCGLTVLWVMARPATCTEEPGGFVV